MPLFSPCSRRLAVVAFALSVFAATNAQAATWTVTNLDDSGAGSLRRAIANADDAPGDHTIVFAPGAKGTITLNKELPEVHEKRTVRIVGPTGPSEGIVIEGNSAQIVDGSLTVSDLTFTKGTSGLGGVFYNRGHLTLNNCDFLQNKSEISAGVVSSTGHLTVNNCRFQQNGTASTDAGAIFNLVGTVVINDSSFEGNTARRGYGFGLAPEGVRDSEALGGGGALHNASGQMTVSRCTFSGNRARKGGAIYNGGDLTVKDSTFAGNESDYGGDLTVKDSTFAGNESDYGGAICNDIGKARLEGSTFSDNKAAEDGGALYNYHEAFHIFNCTFTGNRAAHDGGAIYNLINWVTIESSTLARNQAGHEGGALYLYSKPLPDAIKTDLSNSIVAGNSAPSAPNIWGTVQWAQYTLIDNTSGAKISGEHNITGKAARLGLLADNGGPTRTLALLNGSPAIGQGVTDLSTDQRGLKRPANNHADIGAFEVQKPQSIISRRASASAHLKK